MRLQNAPEENITLGVQSQYDCLSSIIKPIQILILRQCTEEQRSLMSSNWVYNAAGL